MLPLAGAQGDALVTLESALGVAAGVVRHVGRARVGATSRYANAAGELRVGAAFVRDGAIEWNTMPLALDAPGVPLLRRFSLAARVVSPGETATVRFATSAGAGDGVVPSQPRSACREAQCSTRRRPARRRRDDHAEQRAAGRDVASLGRLDRRSRASARLRRPHEPPPELALAQAETQAVSWSVARVDRRTPFRSKCRHERAVHALGARASPTTAA